MKHHLVCGALFAFSVAFLAGCSGASKEEAAVARVMNRPKPGAVRVLNFSKSPVTIWHGNQMLNVKIEPGAAGRFAPVGTGSQTIDVEVDGVKEPVKVDLEPGLGETLIYFGKGETSMVKGEPIKPRDGKNVFVAFLSADGKAETGQYSLDTPGSKVQLSSSESRTVIPAGEIKTSDGKSITVEPDYSYSFFFFKEGNGWKPVLLLNSDNTKPTAAGAPSS